MSMSIIAEETKKRNRSKKKIERWTDLWFTEDKKAGYVAVMDLENPSKQKFYGLNDVKKIVEVTEGVPSRFISINAFDVNFNAKDFSRETNRLKQIRNIAIDIDQYKLGISIDEALEILQGLIYKNIVPEPNLVLTSRGIQLFYSIDGGASPDMSWLAEYITGQFVAKLREVGADNHAKGMSRIMRVPNSINERNNAVVKPYIWHEESYSLQELQTYCRPLDKFKTRRLKQHFINGNYDFKLKRFYKTNIVRRDDLVRLIDLRKGNFTHCRSFFTYSIAFHESLLLDKQVDVLHNVRSYIQDMYSTDPKAERITDTWIKRTVKNAYRDAEEFFNSFKDNGYQVIYKDKDGIKKPYKTSNLIKNLNITEEEQRLMRSIRNEDIAREQEKERKAISRRNAGMKSMQEYNEDRKQRKHNLMVQAVDLRGQGFSYNKVAMKLGISKARVIQLVKEYGGVNDLSG